MHIRVSLARQVGGLLFGQIDVGQTAGVGIFVRDGIDALTVFTESRMHVPSFFTGTMRSQRRLLAAGYVDEPQVRFSWGNFLKQQDDPVVGRPIQCAPSAPAKP